MSTTTNFYDILQLSRDATPADIRTAFKKAALQLHPDRLGPDVSAAVKSEATKMFHLVVTAANCLLDPQSKARYDAFTFGVKLIDITGRISETCVLTDPDSEFEVSPDNSALFLRECRCGGTYSVVVDNSSSSSSSTASNAEPDDDAAVESCQRRQATTSRKFATCDTCSLVLEVICNA